MTTTPREHIITTLKQGLGTLSAPITLADASVKTGLSLHDAKSGLNFLLAEYRGHLAATAEGELLYSFPTGFSKPWEVREQFEEFMAKAKKIGLGVLKFVVRAWITIVMVAYVVIFALILIALTFSKSSDKEENHSLSGTLMFHALFRAVLDSLFWTFHPFSPFYIGQDNYYGYQRPKKAPFYERVNRFFFGPEEKPTSKEELTQLALQEIRAQKGRIGILDLMRVTGLSKEEADHFMASLMLNYDGDVTVAENGGIIYEFLTMRKTALNESTPSPRPIWEKREVIAPFTGNDAGSNMLIAGLNGFNLIMSSIAITNHWTIEKFQYIFSAASQKIPLHALPPPPEGTSLLLGWVPFMFSLTLFAIPAMRALNRGKKRQEIQIKNGKRGLIRAILTKLGFGGIKEETLKNSWEETALVKPDDKVFTREVVKLGGELELNSHDVPLYRFKAIEAEMGALKVARSAASNQEAHIGEVVFSSR